jgi:hypothetical protein
MNHPFVLGIGIPPRCGHPGCDELAEAPVHSKFRFVDDLPPVPSDRRGDPLLVEFADALRYYPGRWAEYPYPSLSNVGARSLARRINTGRGAEPFRHGDRYKFDACTRGGVVYVRYERR